MKKLSKMKNSELAYQMVRLSMGIGFFFHGAVRFTKMQAFTSGLAGEFAGSVFAGAPALTVAYLIPFVEVVSGLLILAGGKHVRWGCFIGGLLMSVIMVGAAIISNWAAITSALVHLAVFYLLLMSPHTKGKK